MTAYTPFISSSTIPNSPNKSPLMSSCPATSPSQTFSLSIKTMCFPILIWSCKLSVLSSTHTRTFEDGCTGGLSIYHHIHIHHIPIFFHTLHGFACSFYIHFFLLLPQFRATESLIGRNRTKLFGEVNRIVKKGVFVLNYCLKIEHNTEAEMTSTNSSLHCENLLSRPTNSVGRNNHNQKFKAFRDWFSKDI